MPWAPQSTPQHGLAAEHQGVTASLGALHHELPPQLPVLTRHSPPQQKKRWGLQLAAGEQNGSILPLHRKSESSKTLVTPQEIRKLQKKNYNKMFLRIYELKENASTRKPGRGPPNDFI